MKKPLVILAALVIAAFGAITFLRRGSSEDTRNAAETGDAGKQRIRTFWALYNKASADRLSQKFEDAIAGYRAALQLNAKHEDSLYYLGTSLEETGEYPEAAATFERLIRLNPASNRAWSELGNTLSRRAPGATPDFERARKAFERSIDINREQAGPFLQLGRLELSEGDTKAAADNFRIAAGFGSPEGNFLLGYTFFLEGRYREAAASFRKVLDGQARERALAGKGITAEGDVLPDSAKPMTSLEKASLKSLLFLYWTSVKLGSYPVDTPARFRLKPPAAAAVRGPKLKIDAPERDRLHSCIERLQKAGLMPRGAVVDCAEADFNRDGRPDLLVLPWLRMAILYLDRGDGRLVDATQPAGLAGIRVKGYSVAVFDYDKDNWPDILVTAKAPFEESVRCLVQPAYKPARDTPRLFHNQGGARFEEVTARVGLNHCYGTIRAVATDIDSDGWTDLVLINGSQDRHRIEPSIALHNLGGKEFREWFYVPGFDRPGIIAQGGISE